MNEFLKKCQHFFATLFTSQRQSLFNIVYLVGKKLFALLLILFALLSVLGVGIGIGYFANVIAKTEIPSQASMKAKIGTLNQSSSLLYANGETIAAVQTDLTRKIVTSDAISPYVKKGLIATEDNLFYEHSGIVPKSVFRAMLQEVAGSDTQTGGSTITQQLVKQQLLSNEVTFARKAKEMLLALRLEKYFTKDEILTAYLNVSPFGRNNSGQNIAGIQAAAEGVFGKNASDLSLPQAAFLVGLPQSPYAYTPYLNTGEKKEQFNAGIKRMQIVLDAMLRDGYITQEEHDQAYHYDISADFLPTVNRSQSHQSYLYQAVHREAVIILMKQQIKAEGKKWEDIDNPKDNYAAYNAYYQKASNLLASAGYRVYSTIDKNIYHNIQDAATQNAYLIGPTYQSTYTDNATGQTVTMEEPPQTGVSIIENETGKILGFVGGTNFGVTQVDHAFTTQRSPGSTIKPLLVYAPAIELKVAYPSTVLADFPINKTQGDGSVWRPTNATGTTSNTFVTARHALQMSMNNPTINLYSAVLATGVNPGDYMQKMGVDSIPQNEYLNLAAAVGGFTYGPTVTQQTSAFTTFANDGVHKNAYLIEKIEDAEGNVVYAHTPQETRVFSEGTAYMTRSMLFDSVNGGTTTYIKQHVNFNLGQIFGKTGTSDDNQDVWVIASTPKVTIGQWMGWDNNGNQKHFLQTYDGNGPYWTRTQKYWASIANAIHAVRPDLFTGTFSPQPATVVQSSVLRSTGTLPGETVLPNNLKVSVTGEMVSDLFFSDFTGAPLNYRFSPGANDTDLNSFWNTIIRQQQTPAPTQPSTQPQNQQGAQNNQPNRQQTNAPATRP
ncbi:penicillin-binding protein [Carnobacteriaceae bacterium zg-C25]|nr:penicillin-binding protein [Carnobacteriaceae bacterium zg-C25]